LELKKDGNFFNSTVSNFHENLTGTAFYDEFSTRFFFLKLKTTTMTKENLEKLTLTELCDLLVESTVGLLDMIENKADGIRLRDQKRKVEVLQEVIRRKRKLKGAV